MPTDPALLKRRRRQLKRIYENHPERLKVQCPECPRRFLNHRGMEMHKWQRHPQPGQPGTAKQPRQSRRKALTQPVERHQGHPVIPMRNPDGSYTHCGRNFAGLWGLKVHMLKVHKVHVTTPHPLTRKSGKRLGRPPGQTKALTHQPQQQQAPPLQPGNRGAMVPGFAGMQLPHGLTAEALFSGTRIISDGHHSSLEMVRMAVRVKLDTYTEVANLIDSVVAPHH